MGIAIFKIFFGKGISLDIQAEHILRLRLHDMVSFNHPYENFEYCLSYPLIEGV